MVLPGASPDVAAAVAAAAAAGNRLLAVVDDVAAGAAARVANSDNSRDYPLPLHLVGEASDSGESDSVDEDDYEEEEDDLAYAARDGQSASRGSHRTLSSGADVNTSPHENLIDQEGNAIVDHNIATVFGAVNLSPSDSGATLAESQPASESAREDDGTLSAEPSPGASALLATTSDSQAIAQLPAILSSSAFDRGAFSARPLSQQSADWCVICFENSSNTTLEPCGHSNLCDACVSRLSKRRCPTCRARAKSVRIYGTSDPAIPQSDATQQVSDSEKATQPPVSPHVHRGYVVKTVKQLVAERRMRESRTLEDTLQIVFLGPADVGKRCLVRTLLSKYPLNTVTHGTRSDTTSSQGSESLPHDCTTPTADTNMDENADSDVYGTGTDFGPNARIAGVPVRLSIVRRGTLTSRRMLLDDVRCLKPDIIVMCCSAHVGPTFEDMLSWDKVLRANVTIPRVWAFLTHPEFDQGPRSPSAPRIAELDQSHHIPSIISNMSPPSIRPRAHYICSTGVGFSIGLRSLAKDVVSYGRTARDEALAAAVAQAEALSLAGRESTWRQSRQGHVYRQDASNDSAERTSQNVAYRTDLHTNRSTSRGNTQPRTTPHALSAIAGGEGYGDHPSTLPRISFRSARESAREVNDSISGFVSWFTGGSNA